MIKYNELTKEAHTPHINQAELESFFW